jgi:hypothetical protein
MSAPDDPRDFKQILAENDVFKLAIRGHAALEDTIDTAIAEGFGGTTPTELRRLPFRTRLVLLEALTPFPKELLGGSLAQTPPPCMMSLSTAHGSRHREQRPANVSSSEASGRSFYG